VGRRVQRSCQWVRLG